MTKSRSNGGTAPPRWHALDSSEAARRFSSDSEQGLSQQTAAERLRSHGPNEIALEEGRSLAAILVGQLKDFMIIVLLAAALIAALLGEVGDSLAIVVIVVLNALVGATQEVRAQRAIAALRRLSALEAQVVRDGKEQRVAASDLVPGDLVILAAGDIVPADMRLLDAEGLNVDESMLTGESLAVAKDAGTRHDEDAPVGDRTNMAFKSTSVTQGAGRGMVVATGKQTEVGRIAHLLADQAPHATPLQLRLAAFGRRLALVVLAICAIVFALGLARGEAPLLMFLTAVSLAVAAIPEALPAVVTASLALGARALSRKNCLVRRLPAVESLGSVTFICSDKTGTLTENRMRLESVLVGNVAAGGSGDLPGDLPAGGLGDRPDSGPGDRPDSGPGDRPDSGSGDRPAGGLGRLAIDGLEGLGESARRELGTALALCNDIGESAKPADDPTEVALAEAAAAAGFDKPSLAARLPRIAAFAFDPARKRMTTLHRSGDGAIAFTKGAPEEVLGICTRALAHDGSVVELDEARMLAATRELAASGHRVLAVAMRRLDEVPGEEARGDEIRGDEARGGEVLGEEVRRDEALGDEIRGDEQRGAIERDLVLLGIVGLSDPVRAEVPKAIADCLSAGIGPIMITGDHPDTARNIGRALRLPCTDAAVMTGRELARLSDDELAARAPDIRIYARVDPEQKIRIVDTLEQSGEFVAMTGDGVNDAPALKRASIGVAMGERGTDVAREAADMVLLDDNFATIVAAIREGRRVYDNIRKFIKYTLTSNSGEIWVLLLAPLLGLPIPLLPIQILWVNLVTDGLPGLAFSAEPAERDVMQRPPRPPGESVFAHGMTRHIAVVGLLIGGLSLATAFFAPAGDVEYWQSMVFTTVVIAQLAQAMAIRSDTQSLWSIGIFSNLFLLGAVCLTLVAQALVLYVPLFNEVLHTTPIAVGDFLICLALGAVVLPIVETGKWVERRRQAKPRAADATHPAG